MEEETNQYENSGPKRAKTTKTERELATMKTKLTKMIRQIAVTLVALVATTSFVAAHDRDSENLHQPASIVGVWQVVRHGVNCSTGQDVFSYSALEIFHDDGTMGSDAGAVVGETREYGVWRQTGSHSYSFRKIFIDVDENGHLLDSGVATVNVVLTSPNTITQTSTVQFFDANGNLIRTGCGRADGTRFQ
jgi:hypothetical protein